MTGLSPAEQTSNPTCGADFYTLSATSAFSAEPSFQYFFLPTNPLNCITIITGSVIHASSALALWAGTATHAEIRTDVSLWMPHSVLTLNFGRQKLHALRLAFWFLPLGGICRTQFSRTVPAQAASSACWVLTGGRLLEKFSRPLHYVFFLISRIHKYFIFSVAKTSASVLSISHFDCTNVILADLPVHLIVFLSPKCTFNFPL